MGTDSGSRPICEEGVWVYDNTYSYEYPVEYEWRRHSAAATRVSLNGHGKGVMMNDELDLWKGISGKWY